MTTATKNAQLTKRDRDVFDHIHRYRVSTLEVLHRLFWKPPVSVNAVSQRLGRLEGYIQSADLVGSRDYYLLRPAMAQEYGEDHTFSKALQSPSLARHIAMLEYCCLGEEWREKITSREFKLGYPSYDISGVRRDSYFHTDSKPAKLGWLEVDGGRDARKRAQKCLKKFKLRVAHEKFRRMVERDQFYVVLVTTSPSKREQLRYYFDKMERFPVEIIVNTTVRDIILAARIKG